MSRIITAKVMAKQLAISFGMTEVFQRARRENPAVILDYEIVVPSDNSEGRFAKVFFKVANETTNFELSDDNLTALIESPKTGVFDRMLFGAALGNLRIAKP